MLKVFTSFESKLLQYWVIIPDVKLDLLYYDVLFSCDSGINVQYAFR